jgi:serine/threonine protein kinase
MGKLLGQGNFGKVFVGTHKTTKNEFAIKMIDKQSLKADVMQQLMQQELGILASLNHPNIVRVFDLLEDEKYYYIVQELMKGGALLDTLEKKKKLDMKYVSRIIT